MPAAPKPTNDKHMGWRGSRKNYCWPGIYHITISVFDRQQQPLGRITGDLSKPDGDPLAPRVHLSDICITEGCLSTGREKNCAFRRLFIRKIIKSCPFWATFLE